MKFSLFFLAMIGLVCGVIFSYFGSLHPVFDTGANFRIHMSALLFLGAIIWIVKGLKIRGAIFAAIASIALYSSASGFLAASNDYDSPEGKKTYKLLHLNLYYANPTPSKVFDLIARENPDFLFLNEYSTVWKNRFDTKVNAYPHRSQCAEHAGLGGTIILSKIPFDKGGEYCHHYGALNLRTVPLENVPVTLGSVHLRWPWPASGPSQVTAMTPALLALPENAILAGDFNSAPWTYLLQRFAQSGGLTIVEWIGPTWIFRKLPIGLAKYTGLPLDNVMHKGAVKIVEAKTLQPVGSDHLPVLVQFYIEK